MHAVFVCIWYCSCYSLAMFWFAENGTEQIRDSDRWRAEKVLFVWVNNAEIVQMSFKTQKLRTQKFQL